MTQMVLGLDPSLTGFGVARVWPDFTFESQRISRDLKGVRRLLYLEAVLEEIIGHDIHRPELIVLEGYSYASANKAHQIGELGGIVRKLCFLSGIATVVCPPLSLKKFVTGRGNAKKDEMRLEAYKRFEIEAESQDEVEAACLGVLGWHWLGTGEDNEDGHIPLRVPKGHLEALSKVTVLD